MRCLRLGQALCLSLFTATVSFLSAAFSWQALFLRRSFFLCRAFLQLPFLPALFCSRFFFAGAFSWPGLFLDGELSSSAGDAASLLTLPQQPLFHQNFSLRGSLGLAVSGLIRNLTAEDGASSAETHPCVSDFCCSSSSTSTNSLSPPAGPWLFVPSMQASERPTRKLNRESRHHYRGSQIYAFRVAVCVNTRLLEF